MTVYINGKRRNVLRIVCENSTYVRNCFPGNPKICLRNVNHANMIHTKRIRTYVRTYIEDARQSGIVYIKGLARCFVSSDASDESKVIT